MKCTECSRCKWADIADKPRTIIKGGTTIVQSAGSVNCTCKNIKEMTITDDGLCCSSWLEREDTE